MKKLKHFAVIAVVAMLSGCFYLGAPFKANGDFSTLSTAEPVVIGITHVTLGSDAQKNAAFWENTQRVIDALPRHDGYLGHKVRKRLFVNDAWTMTIWKDANALDKFVTGDQHRLAMTTGLPAVKSGRFLRITVPRNEAPIAWKTAEQLMASKGRKLY